MGMTRGCRACLQGVAREAAPAVEAALELRGGERAALHSQGHEDWASGHEDRRQGTRAPWPSRGQGASGGPGEGGTPLSLQLGRQGETFCLNRARTRGLA